MLAGLSAGLTNGSFAVLLTDLFPTRIRFTGVALVFNVSFTIFSGTAPLVATSLIREHGLADVAGVPDDVQRRARVDRQPVGREIRRQRDEARRSLTQRGADPSGSNVPCCIVNDFSFDANATSFSVL